MRAEPELFRYVRQPDGGAFFDRNGLLFLSVAELEALSEQLIAAQPLIGNLARDPSLRGLFDTLALFIAGAGKDHAAVSRLDPTLAAIGDAVKAVLEGRAEPLSWQQIIGLQICRQKVQGDSEMNGYQLNLAWSDPSGNVKRHCLLKHAIRGFVSRLARRYESLFGFTLIDHSRNN